jgi:enoyl-CoA hydratase
VTTISFDRRGEVAILRFTTPILSRDLLGRLTEALDLLAGGDALGPLVLASDHPTIFLAGAHLAEIAALDADSCACYAELGRAVSDRLSSHPAPVVAAVAGSCSGGGFDLVLACDTIVASPTATFRHPGVLRGLVTGWGGTSSMPGALGRSSARRVFMEADELSAAVLQELGAVAVIDDDPESAAVEKAVRLSRLDPFRLPLWRLLRGPGFVDRFRAVMVEKS